MRVLFSLGLNMRNKIILILCLLSPLSFGSTLNDIKFAELPGERFEVRMSFDDAPPEPKGYTIEKPARIVLDFPDVVSSLKERRFPLAFDNGQSAMVLTTEGRTRLIVNLDELSSYVTRKEGNSYILEIGASQGGVGSKTASAKGIDLPKQSPISPKNTAIAGRSEITDIDFRRGQAGEGKIIVTLSNPKVSADLVGTGAGVNFHFLAFLLHKNYVVA